MIQTMKKKNHTSAERDKKTSSLTNDSEGQILNYEPDDGMVTHEVIEQIKKLVPQLDFKNAEFLF